MASRVLNLDHEPALVDVVPSKNHSKTLPSKSITMPRKSNVSQVSATGGEEGTPAKEKPEGVNIEDLSLPRTMVQRLAKGVLPPNTQIQKDAVTAMCKGATVFVNHIADKYDFSSVFNTVTIYENMHANVVTSSSTFDASANELTISASRKTISPKTVLDALRECEYADFLPRVEAELNRFNEIATGKRNEYRRKIKEKEMGVSSSNAGGNKYGDSVNGEGRAEASMGMGMGMDGEDEEEVVGDGERASKRMRRDEGFIDEGAGVGQGQRQKHDVPVNGTPAPAMETSPMDDDDDDDNAEVERQFEREEEAEAEQRREEDEEEEEEEEEDEEISDEVEEDEEEGAESGADKGARLRAVQDGLSSGVDEGSEEESD
ncbi:MAG: hypothetical protein Q9181_000225 [Wetmoreana brouardii]